MDFSPEPPTADNPLWSLPNVLVTPHVGGVTQPGAQPAPYAVVFEPLSHASVPFTVPSPQRGPRVHVAVQPP